VDATTSASWSDTVEAEDDFLGGGGGGGGGQDAPPHVVHVPYDFLRLNEPW